MIVDARQLTALCDIALAAGEAAMEVYRTEFSEWTKPDSSPLTQADLDSDAMIRDGLASAFPGVHVMSEESSETRPRRDTDHFFLVDPLDGTKEFLNRNGEFTVNIALILDGRPIAGVVYAPAVQELFFAAEGQTAMKQAGRRKTPLRVSAADPARPLRVIGSRSHGADALNTWLAGIDRPYTLVSSGSSLKFCRIAEGAADIYPRFGLTSQWDTAAAQGVLEQAGGIVADLEGRPLRYGLDRPVLNPWFAAAADARLLELLPRNEQS